MHLFGRTRLLTPRVLFGIDLPYHLCRLGYLLHILHHTQLTLHKLWRDHILLILDLERPQFLHTSLDSLDSSDTLRVASPPPPPPPPYPTRPGGRMGSEDADQFYHINIFKYCRNKCRIIISIKEGPPFCQLTISFNMTCIPFQHYHLQNIIKVYLHK